MDTNRDRSLEIRDGETIRLLKHRRPDGLRQLLQDYGAQVRWNLQTDFGRSLNETEIDEVINLAAHRVWRTSDTYDGSRGTLRAWFYMISRRFALSVLRRERRARRLAKFQDWDRIPVRDVKSNRREPTEKHQRFIEDLRFCIDKLAPLQMSIIKADLRSGELADAGELARTFRTSKNSIYASRSIARKRLKRELIKLGHSAGGTTTL